MLRKGQPLPWETPSTTTTSLRQPLRSTAVISANIKSILGLTPSTPTVDRVTVSKDDSGGIRDEELEPVVPQYTPAKHRGTARPGTPKRSKEQLFEEYKTNEERLQLKIDDLLSNGDESDLDQIDP